MCFTISKKNMKTIPSKRTETDASLSFGITNDILYDKLKTEDSLLLLDIRSKTEYDSKHIQGSTRVSSYIKTEIGIIPKIEDAKKEIILICRDGVESRQYAKLLNNSGKTVRYLMGGIDKWNHSLYHPSYLT